MTMLASLAAAVEALHERGAHVGGLVGVIPASLRRIVVDVDASGTAWLSALQEVLGAPVTVTDARRDGGYHAWYRAPVGTRNDTLNREVFKTRRARSLISPRIVTPGMRQDSP